MFEISDIILGALLKGPANGYQVRRRIGRDFAHFQSISTGGLYPALSKLKACGAIIETGSANKSLDNRTFAITDHGRTRLHQKVQEAGAGERLKSDFLAAVYFSESAGPEETTRLIEERAGTLNQEIRALLALPLQSMSNTERFTVRYALVVRRAGLEFLRREGRAIAAAINIEHHNNR